MKNKRILLYLFLAVIVISILVIIWSIINGEKEVINNITEITPAEEISDEQLRTTNISLYYINVENGEIEKENRQIDSKKLMNNPCLELLNIWKEGPTKNNLSTGISNEFKIIKTEINDNCAIIDFDNEFLKKKNEEINELKIIYCIVDTLTELNEIDSVKILINGQENVYFGNINLSEKYCKLSE